MQSMKSNSTQNVTILGAPRTRFSVTQGQVEGE